MAEVKLRYNPEAEEVELVVDDEVALSSGSEVFASWVESYNEAHPVEPVVEPEPEETEEDKLRAALEVVNADLAAARAELEVAHAANTPDPEPEPAPEVDAEPEA